MSIFYLVFNVKKRYKVKIYILKKVLKNVIYKKFSKMTPFFKFIKPQNKNKHKSGKVDYKKPTRKSFNIIKKMLTINFLY